MATNLTFLWYRCYKNEQAVKKISLSMVVSLGNSIYNYLLRFALSVSLQSGWLLGLLSGSEGWTAMEKEVEVIKAQKVMVIGWIMHI